MTRIRVLLADDHTLVRAGIRALLKEMPGIEVVAEANNGREAIELAATHQPHVVLMDIMMPEMNGLDATARLTAKVPDGRHPFVAPAVNADFAVRQRLGRKPRRVGRQHLLAGVPENDHARVWSKNSAKS